MMDESDAMRCEAKKIKKEKVGWSGAYLLLVVCVGRAIGLGSEDLDPGDCIVIVM